MDAATVMQNLPQSVAILTNIGEKTAGISWNIPNTYDPTKLTPQTITARGTLTLPLSISPNGVSTSITLQVTIDGANLQTIVAPDAITGLENGSPKTVEGLKLPKTVKLQLEKGYATGTVTWDLESANYRPNSKATQSFQVSGTVTLPEGVNVNGKELTTQVQVSVSEREVVPKFTGDTDITLYEGYSQYTSNAFTTSGTGTVRVELVNAPEQVRYSASTKKITIRPGLREGDYELQFDIEDDNTTATQSVYIEVLDRAFKPTDDSESSGSGDSSQTSLGTEQSLTGKPKITRPDTIPKGKVGENYSLSFATTGGAVTTWSLANGTLPDGLTMDPTTGTIAGLPTVAGTKFFTVRAANASGASDLYISVVISPAPVTQEQQEQSQQEQQVVTVQPEVQQPVYTVPQPDVTVTPETTYTPEIPIGNMDAMGGISRDDLAPKIESFSLKDGMQHADYTAMLSATGDSLTWELESGVLPDGIELLAAGGLRGAPTESGTFDFSLKVSNQYGEDIKEARLVIEPDKVVLEEFKLEASSTVITSIDDVVKITAVVYPAEYEITDITWTAGDSLAQYGDGDVIEVFTSETYTNGPVDVTAVIDGFAASTTIEVAIATDDPFAGNVEQPNQSMPEAREGVLGWIQSNFKLAIGIGMGAVVILIAMIIVIAKVRRR
jgi:hypothetical protein